LILKDKFDYLVENVFNHNKLFYDTISDEFGMFLKLNSLIPKFLCQFIDQKLRKGKYSVNIILHTFLYFNIYLITLMANLLFNEK